MARSRTPAAAQEPPGLDRTGAPGAQARPRGAAVPDGAANSGDLSSEEIGTGEDWSEGAVHRGRLRVRTLVTLRWLVAAGEVALLLLVMAMGFHAPYVLCFV